MPKKSGMGGASAAPTGSQRAFKFDIECRGPKSGRKFVRVGWETSVVAADEISMVTKYRNAHQQAEMTNGGLVIDALDGRSVRALVLLKDGKLIRASRPAQEIQNDLLS